MEPVVEDKLAKAWTRSYSATIWLSAGIRMLSMVCKRKFCKIAL